MQNEKAGFYKQLRELVLPITFQLFMAGLVSAGDAIMLGFVNQTSLSAASLAGQVQFVLTMFVSGIAGGLSILAAQYWGKGDRKTIEHVTPIALRANLIFSGLFTLAAFVMPQTLMRIFTNVPELIEAGGDYLFAVAASYVLFGISQIYLTLLRSTGHADISSCISASAVIIDIILNAIMIFGLFGFPRMGILGAAWSTSISRAIELFLSLLATHRSGEVKVRWAGIFERQLKLLVQDFWRYTIPVLTAALVWGLAFVSYSVILGHLGSDAVAANSITTIVRDVVACLVKGLGNGAGVMVGHVLGAGDMERAKSYSRRLIKLAAVAGIGSGLLLMAVSPLVVRVAPLTHQAGRYLQFLLIMSGLNLMAQSLNHTILDGIFYAGGDSQFDVIGNIFAMWCFAVPLGFLAAFVFHWSVYAVFVIIFLDEIVKLPVVIRRYYKYVWLRNITRDFD